MRSLTELISASVKYTLGVEQILLIMLLKSYNMIYTLGCN